MSFENKFYFLSCLLFSQPNHIPPSSLAYKMSTTDSEADIVTTVEVVDKKAHTLRWKRIQGSWWLLPEETKTVPIKQRRNRTEYMRAYDIKRKGKKRVYSLERREQRREYCRKYYLKRKALGLVPSVTDDLELREKRRKYSREYYLKQKALRHVEATVAREDASPAIEEAHTSPKTKRQRLAQDTLITSLLVPSPPSPPVVLVEALPETYSKKTTGPCCLCGSTLSGKNGWHYGFLGPNSFCSPCYQANTKQRKSICYKWDNKDRLIIVNDSLPWKKKGFPVTFFASDRISKAMKEMPDKFKQRFKNWMSAR